MANMVAPGYYADSDDASDFSIEDGEEDAVLPDEVEGVAAWANKKWDAFQVRKTISFITFGNAGF